MKTGIVQQASIDRRSITVVPTGLRHIIQRTLHHFFIGLEGNSPAENTSGSAVNERYNVRFVFLCSMKV